MVESMVVSKAEYWAFSRVGLRAVKSAAWRDSSQAVHWVGRWGECWVESTAGGKAVYLGDSMAVMKVAPTASQTAETKASQQVVAMAASRARMSVDSSVGSMADGWDDRSVGMSENASVGTRADLTDARSAVSMAVRLVALMVDLWVVMKVVKRVAHWAVWRAVSTADNLAVPTVACSACYWAVQRGDSMAVWKAARWAGLWAECSAARKAGP
jgi:hypothetical protein